MNLDENISAKYRKHIQVKSLGVRIVVEYEP